MAGKSISGEGLTPDLAGMTKNQLYDIMSQMKALIEQNKQQAREILIQNPALTRALFQAQIMLGMVQPPQVIPNIQPVASQQPQQSALPPLQQSNTQATRSFPGQVGLQDQAGASQLQLPMRKQHQSQPAMPISTASTTPANNQPQQIPSHPLLQPPQQLKGHLSTQVTQISGSQPSQHPNISSLPLHSTAQPNPLHQPQMPSVSSQSQQPLQMSGVPHMPLQPPMPPQPRPSTMPSFHHQYGSQMGPNVGFQHAPQHPSQPMYHSGNKPQTSMVPSFPQGQPTLQNQPLPQLLYQAGGSHLGADFSNQSGGSMQIDRGPSWMPGPPDTSTMAQLSGPPPLAPGHMGPPGNQTNRSAPLTPDMEKALLQQVMSLTSEQINLLPPEQRNQVLQLQQMLRQ